jgi:hypothetical protein
MKEAHMNRIILTSILLITAVALLPAQEMGLTGEVSKVEEITSTEGDLIIMQLHVRTRNRETIMAQLGPAWMMESDVEIGDEITVRGKHNEENHIMVRELIHNNVRHYIRDEYYEPLWLRRRLRAQNQIYNPQNEKQVKGKITELYVDELSSMMEAILREQNGELVRVRLAPEWYLRNQLRVGDELELRGSTAIDNDGMLIMTREMRNMRTNLEIALRNRQGFPDWYGKEKSAEKQRGKPYLQEEHTRRGRGQGH